MARAAVKEKTDTAPADTADASNAGKEVAVSNGAPPAGPKTVAQENKDKLQRVLAELAKRADDYRPLLAAHGIPWEAFCAIIQQALIKVPFTLKCTTASILQACMRAAADGLFPDGDECALVPFKNSQANRYEATYVPGYKGMLKCAYAMQDGTGAKVYQDVDVDVIYEGEEGHFKVRKGTDPSLTFEPPLNRDINKPVVGAYAVVRTNNGGIFVEVVGQMELGKIASVSKAKNGPREKWGAEMHKKGPLRRLLKRTPKDQRLARLISHDEEAYLPDAVSMVDGDDTIPDDKLFDDTTHQIEHTDDEGGNPLMAQARADLMACEDEAALEGVIANIDAATKAFSVEERAELVANAEQLRAHRWPKAEGSPLAEATAELHATLEAAGNGDAAALANLPAAARAVTDAAQGLTQEEVRPTATASAQAADAGLASSDSATPASTASAAATSSPAASSPPSGAGKSGEWQDAPPERRMTPSQVLLEGEEHGVHFKANIAVNAHGQVPMFNRADEIVGWAKPDLDIPTLPQGAAPPAASGAETPASSPSPKPSDSSTTATTAGQDGGATSASPSDQGGDDYGDAPPVFRLKVKPSEPPKEYADATEWRDAIIFKMASLKDNAAAFPRWWADNKAFVEEAIVAAPKAAGRVITQAVAYKLPGAKDLVDQYGPFQ